MSRVRLKFWRTNRTDDESTDDTDDSPPMTDQDTDEFDALRDRIEALEEAAGIDPEPEYEHWYYIDGHHHDVYVPVDETDIYAAPRDDDRHSFAGDGIVAYTDVETSTHFWRITDQRSAHDGVERERGRWFRLGETTIETVTAEDVPEDALERVRDQ